jgi:2-polyprenyl-3-methyl-5-hydroxy-6-metoxy-1,4-benzoquinol methylase
MNCLVCGSAALLGRAAVVTPFLAERIWKRPAFGARLESCSECSFQFFVPRLTDEEQGKLYAGYRAEAYQKERESFEPWYTVEFNANFDSEESLEYRRSFIAAVFDRELRQKEVNKVLDFGGHRGELIAGLLQGAKAFVYDVSGITPIAGVSIVSSPQECRAHNFDLIVCSNVMEHVSEPRRTLDELVQAAGPTTLVFLEVPEEVPLGFWSMLKRLLQFVVLVVKRPKVALKLPRRGLLLQMHEHVNCFSPQSLTRLLTTSGWHIESSGSYNVNGMRVGPFRFAGSRMLWVFATAPGT